MEMEPDASGDTGRTSVKILRPKAKGLQRELRMDCFMLRGPLLLLYMGAIGSVLLPLSAGQSGYISIDCGNTGDYTDQNGLNWTTDSGYISVGSNRVVTVTDNQSSYAHQMSTARVFDESASKSCYKLPVDSNSSYLVRAGFLFGDLSLPLPVGYSFNLSIDSTIVDTIKLPSIDDIYTQMLLEYLVASGSTSNQLLFCIIPVIRGLTFISSLELRQLANDMYYSQVLFNFQYMKNLLRANYGVDRTSPVIRYPYDSFDRLWTGPGWSGNLIAINTTRHIDVISFSKPPEKVLQTALTVPAVNFPIALNLNASVPLDVTSVYVSLYFAEIRNTSTSGTDIEIYLESNLWFNITLGVSSTEVAGYDINPYTWTPFNWRISASKNSPLPPLVNGAEMFAIYDIVTTTTAPSDVSAANNMQQQFSNLMLWTGDPCLPVSWDWIQCKGSASSNSVVVTKINVSGYQLTGAFPESIANFSSLTELWLNNNSITGSIPDLSGMTNLRTLHLQNNGLTGTIPASLADIPNLSELFLENNNLTGPVPAALQTKAANGLKLTVGNLSNASTSAPVSSGTSKKSGSSGGVIGGVIGGVAGGIILIGIVAFALRRRNKTRRKTVSGPGLPIELTTTGSGGYDKAPSPTHSPISAPSDDSLRGFARNNGVQHAQGKRMFSLAQVQDATNNYERKIGEGGFGPVYYGRLPNGQEVAVKVKSATSKQESCQFSNEVRLLSTVHHVHLVSLVGFCEEDDQQILIYEYMVHGTLEDHICNRDLAKGLDWRSRLSVALGAARGLEYLHVFCRPTIIHRDVKSSNILMNERFEAKVGDFGISKETYNINPTGVQTIVQGTFGYLDPEYYHTHKVTHKSDVYAFGVVLLEIISGLPAVDHSTTEATLDSNLAHHARSILQDGDLEGLVDPSLKGSYNKDAMWGVAELALECIQMQGKKRPEMTRVVSDLVEAVRMEHADVPTQTISSPSKLGVQDAGASAFLGNVAARSDTGIYKGQSVLKQPRLR